jgi:hypothetical protein
MKFLAPMLVSLREPMLIWSGSRKKAIGGFEKVYGRTGSDPKQGIGAQTGGFFSIGIPYHRVRLSLHIIIPLTHKAVFLYTHLTK